MIRPTPDEVSIPTSRVAICDLKDGGRRFELKICNLKERPRGPELFTLAFTEQGVAMLSSVRNSERAIEVNIAIKRAFVRLRQMLESNEALNRKFAAVIRKFGIHDKYVTVVFDELKKLNAPATRPLNR